MFKRIEPGTGLEDAREGVLVRGNGTVEHVEEEAEGLAGGARADEGTDEDVVGLGGWGWGVAEDFDGVVEAAGDDEGRGFEEVFGDSRVEDDAGFDEVGVDLVQVSEGLALLEEQGFGVGGDQGRVWDGGKDGKDTGHILSLSLQEIEYPEQLFIPHLIVALNLIWLE